MGVLIWLGAFFQADIEPNIPPTCRPLCTFFGPFEGTQMAQSGIEKTFSDCRPISPTRMGLKIWLGAHFEANTLGHTSSPPAGLCVLFWVHLGVP
jgi:hypothetical protein